MSFVLIWQVTVNSEDNERRGRGRRDERSHEFGGGEINV